MGAGVPRRRPCLEELEVVGAAGAEVHDGERHECILGHLLEQGERILAQPRRVPLARLSPRTARRGPPPRSPIPPRRRAGGHPRGSSVRAVRRRDRKGHDPLDPPVGWCAVIGARHRDGARRDREDADPRSDRCPLAYRHHCDHSHRGGHGDFRLPHEVPRGAAGHLSHIELLGVATIADAEAEVLRASREVLRQGASQLKLMAGGGVASHYDPRDVSQYAVAEMQAAVSAAENWGTYVTVNAYTPRAIRMAVEAGVRCIEHGQLIDRATAELLAEHDVWWCLQPFLDDEDAVPMTGPNRDKQLAMVAGTDRADELAPSHGVKVAFGTDTRLRRAARHAAGRHRGPDPRRRRPARRPVADRPARRGVHDHPQGRADRRARLTGRRHDAPGPPDASRAVDVGPEEGDGDAPAGHWHCDGRERSAQLCGHRSSTRRSSAIGYGARRPILRREWPALAVSTGPSYDIVRRER
ncbi:amidohydrolase family protein [Brachybacterium saurashtrense]|uniref:amidohydrolase family protein n=1 Tax=Brachybacterium saurashtrense TaxID=556288 RepID=UPI0024082E10|nr:amidohydrolase family protein [Brachybacterium saurashtrense]